MLLHDSALKINLSYKLQFWWTGPYQVRDVIKKKETYFLKKLDGISYRDHIHDNQIKKFWLHKEKQEEQTSNINNEMDETLNIKKIIKNCTNRIKRNQPKAKEDKTFNYS